MSRMRITRIVIVSGDREWYHTDVIRDVLKTFDRKTVVITGGADGADTIAHNFAQHIGLRAVQVPALWRTQGRAGGAIRNSFMLQLLQALHLQWPDAVVEVHAFHDHIEDSKGTADMIEQAEKVGVPHQLHRSGR